MALVSNTIIRFDTVVKEFDDNVVLKEVSFEIEQGKFYTLLGPSGCGKTTILRLIAGFSEPTSGDIYFDGKKINQVPANKRKVNTVFQDYALFPHMNVFHNVAFGLKIKKLAENINKFYFKKDLTFYFTPKSTLFNLKEFKITESELKLISAAAIIGDNKIPKKG